MLKLFVRTLVLGLLVSVPVGADDITSAATELCEKVKSCALAQIKEQELTPEMKQMMQPMLDNMCATMQSRVGEVDTGHTLHDPALACMRSMEKLSCQQMMNPEQVQTSECEEYEKLLRASGEAP